MVKSAAIAASLETLQAEKLDFQAVLKSAASSASRNPRGAQPPPSSLIMASKFGFVVDGARVCILGLRDWLRNLKQVLPRWQASKL